MRLKKLNFAVTKREKFVFGIISLSVVLFISENLLGRSGASIVFSIAVFSPLFLYWAIRKDLKENFSPQVFILPFLFSLSFGLFFFLVPARFLTRFVATSLYGFGLYSLFLSGNIFIVSSIRTIALLASARTVSFVITILSYFFLSTVVFTLHLDWYLLIPSVFIFTFLLVLHSLWTYTLDKKIFSEILWVFFITLSLTEIAAILWFWPTTPTIIALFMTGFFYSVVGTAQMWLEKRLFKSVISEYLWVSIIVFFVIIAFTSWT